MSTFIARSFSLLVFGILFGACADVTKAHNEAPPMAVENSQLPAPFSEFTTQGKLTRTLSTPDGNVDIYDPTQDPDVRQAFRTVYDWGVANDASAEPIRPPFDYSAYHQFLSYHVRAIQKSDLMRANCTTLVVPPKGAQYAGHDALSCPLNWGEPLSACESRMMNVDEAGDLKPQTLRHEMEPERPALTDSKADPVTTAALQHVGPRSTRMPFDTFEEQLDAFFTAECRTFRQ